jgi:multicomponent Na+:H+ antiporter subunit D
MRTGIYPPELRSINLDFDWFYRRLAPTVILAIARWAESAWNGATSAAERAMRNTLMVFERHAGPDGTLARTWPTGSMAFWATVMLAAYLILSYL